MPGLPEDHRWSTARQVAVVIANRRAAASLLRAVAFDDDIDNGARLHCLIAADLLDPSAPITVSAPWADPEHDIRNALRLLAHLPDPEFTRAVRTAARHARHALLALSPRPDADLPR